METQRFENSKLMEKESFEQTLFREQLLLAEEKIERDIRKSSWIISLPVTFGFVTLLVSSLEIFGLDKIVEIFEGFFNGKNGFDASAEFFKVTFSIFGVLCGVYLSHRLVNRRISDAKHLLEKKWEKKSA